MLGPACDRPQRLQIYAVHQIPLIMSGVKPPALLTGEWVSAEILPRRLAEDDCAHPCWTVRALTATQPFAMSVLSVTRDTVYDGTWMGVG